MRAGYHNLLRREILELVPTTAKAIFDLGCGTGILGQALKQRQACDVEGIELNKEAAECAKENLDRVFCDNLNRFNPQFTGKKYDCLILADILEHLISPWLVLKKFADVLTDDGVVIASIPNIAHPYIISQLQKGLFRYKLAGLLDVTHLRFFTKTTIGQLFYKAGLKILSITPAPDAKNPIQYLVTACKPALEHKKPTTTILILTYNCWQYTNQCIASIKERTFEPYKILVIDNGSTDETIGEIRRDPQIFNIENSCNLGFGPGYNIGIDCIDTPYFVICGSDTVVTTGWLTKMIKNMNTDKKLIMLGPRSNNVSGPQRINNVPYKTAATLEAYAKERAQNITDPITYCKRIVFFFTLLRTEAIRKVGIIDERFELGNYEDDDYCMRVNGVGLKTAYDNTVFIHHYGSQTFKANNIKFEDTMTKNQAKFLAKWKIPNIEAYYNYLKT